MFFYTVTAKLFSKLDAEHYLNWLNDGHIQALLPWAIEAQVICLDSQKDNEYIIQSRYLFNHRVDFERYQKEGAPQLQAEGRAFATQLSAIEFERNWGTLHTSIKRP